MKRRATTPNGNARKGATTRNGKPASKALKTLAIDIGGTGLKASVLDAQGNMLSERVRVETPQPSTPDAVLEALLGIVTKLPAFDRVSVGFPGVVRGGRIVTAANLGQGTWSGFELESALAKRLGNKPVRIINDADMQGFAAIEGKGVELVVTLGTGFGSALFQDGRLAPHLELAHHPFCKGMTYEECVGNEARKKAGNKKWSKRVLKVLDCLRKLIYFDRVHVGGGNAKHLTVELPSYARVVSNTAGILGGIALWEKN